MIRNLFFICTILNMAFFTVNVIAASWGIAVFNLLCGALCYIGYVNNE